MKKIKCLGWCEGYFIDNDNSNKRYCKKCADKKSKIETKGIKLYFIGTDSKGKFMVRSNGNKL